MLFSEPRSSRRPLRLAVAPQPMQATECSTQYQAKPSTTRRPLIIREIMVERYGSPSLFG